MTTWVSVKDKLPDVPRETQYLITDGIQKNLGTYSGGTCGDWWDVKVGYIVTHWMPLPELPRKKHLCESEHKTVRCVDGNGGFKLEILEEMNYVFLVICPVCPFCGQRA